MPSLTSPMFRTMVQALKRQKKSITVVESCCGGLINASILAQPGASAVYYGGSIAYNTRRAKPFLLNNDTLHESLQRPFVASDVESEKDKYIQSKVSWTRQTSMAFCQEVGTDLCIAEGGATGPTFRPQGLNTGFSVIAVASKDASTGNIDVVRQEIIHSTHADREANMRLFADEAAKLVLDVLGEKETTSSTTSVEEQQNAKRVFMKDPILDRATKLRSDEKALADMSKDAKYLVLYKSKALFRDTGSPDSRELAFLSQEQVQNLADGTEMTYQTSFLGLLDGHEPVFGVDMIGETDDEAFNAVTAMVATSNNGLTKFEDTRTVAPLLLPGHKSQNELALYATALSQWQRRAQHCVACGGTTELLDGGTSRRCTSCGQRSWPRQDPSMIAVVSSRDGQRALLGRSPRHAPKIYTALAGFVEAGETMERAVAREVYEETGIRVDEDSVRYVASQPWPFPQSTMIGFTATADDENQVIDIDRDELVDAAWFDKEQVLAATKVPGAVMQPEIAKAAIEANPNLDLLIPPKGVLARKLIDTWLGL